MRPLIGITADRDAEVSLLKDAYGSAVRRHGGLPVALISPSELSAADGSTPGDDEVSQLADLIDGLLLPGGADLVPEFYGEVPVVPPGTLRLVDVRRSAFERALLREALARRRPILAICYGMQLLNVALGGSLFQDIMHQVPRARDHRRGTHRVRILKGPAEMSEWTEALSGKSVVVNSSHHQAVKTLGDGLEAFAVAEDGVIEGLVMNDRPFLVGVQWHPERSLSEPLSADLFSCFVRSASAHREPRRG